MGFYVTASGTRRHPSAGTGHGDPNRARYTPPEMRARRKDSNQAEIESALVALGCEVEDTSALPGFVDLVVCTPARDVLLIEVKDGSKPPSARRLTPRQAALHARFPVAVVATKDEAESLLNHTT